MTSDPVESVEMKNNRTRKAFFGSIDKSRIDPELVFAGMWFCKMINRNEFNVIDGCEILNDFAQIKIPLYDDAGELIKLDDEMFRGAERRFALSMRMCADALVDKALSLCNVSKFDTQVEAKAFIQGHDRQCTFFHEMHIGDDKSQPFTCFMLASDRPMISIDTPLFIEAFTDSGEVVSYQLSSYMSLAINSNGPATVAMAPGMAELIP